MLSSNALLALAVCACAASLAVARSYSNGLIFYELQSHTPYLPPTVSVSRGRNLASAKYSEKGSIWSTFGQPCECRGMICGCCAGLKVDQYKFDQKVCANITFVPQLEEAQVQVYLNERQSAKYGISVRNPSPFCIPVMMGVPMAMCVQLTDVAMVGNNLNMCMDFVVRLATTDLFEMHFQCMRMGLDGVQYVDKNGQPVIPTASTPQADEDDRDTLEYDYAEMLEGEQQEEMQHQLDDQITELPKTETAEPESETESEPLKIESEMLMAGDEDLVESTTDAGDGDDDDGDNDDDNNDDNDDNAEVQLQVKGDEVQEETKQESAADDKVGESDLKQNEVIETITNSIQANEVPAAAAATATETTAKPEDEEEASYGQQQQQQQQQGEQTKEKVVEVVGQDQEEQHQQLQQQQQQLQQQQQQQQQQRRRRLFQRLRSGI
ncbi:GH24068 [Drosophila grimshawi]|uniref:GH24068 n=1 Tax=Drosophila grimshawi TaxID=7222 RepID=B4JNX1_DROGR|nr:GH24068 [Drosophila grimshawi]